MAIPSTSASDAVELLRGVPALAQLDDSLLQRMAVEVELVSLAAGEWLFRKGDEARCAYVIANGRLEIVAEAPEEHVIRVLRRGSAIGELALLRGGRRTASARARRHSSLISLDRGQFEALLTDAPGFALALMHTLAAQLASTGAPAGRAQRPTTLAVLALDDRVPGAAAAAALAAEVARYGSTVCMTVPPGDVPHEWARALAREEHSQDQVVLFSPESDPGNPWTSFCLQEAELIVALTAGSPRPEWLTHAQALVDCELVVVGGRANDQLIDRLRPKLVRAVAEPGGLGRVMAEVGRRAAGRSVGVVLSGGGARAFAHVGVLEHLIRAGVPVDRVAGVSQGAIIGAMFARGDSPEAAYGHCQRYFVDQNPAGDYTLPLVSAIRGRKTAQLLHEGFGEARIESLSTPFFCTSTDLLRRETFIHSTGSLAEALLASASIPGVFPPTPGPDGRLLVDGGVTDNLPVRAMAGFGAGAVIAVDVTGTGAADDTPTALRGRRTWRAALRRAITGSDAPLPRLPETIFRCMTLASADTVATARQYADLVITPDVSEIGLLDWRQLPTARRAGLAAAEQALAGSADFVARVCR